MEIKGAKEVRKKYPSGALFERADGVSLAAEGGQVGADGARGDVQGGGPGSVNGPSGCPSEKHGGRESGKARRSLGPGLVLVQK